MSAARKIFYCGHRELCYATIEEQLLTLIYGLDRNLSQGME